MPSWRWRLEPNGVSRFGGQSSEVLEKSDAPDEAGMSDTPDDAGMSDAPDDAGKSDAPDNAGMSDAPGEAGMMLEWRQRC